MEKKHAKSGSSRQETLPLSCAAAVVDKIRTPMGRKGFGRNGRQIRLNANHFKVEGPNTKEDLYQYSVSISYEDGTDVNAKGIGREVIEKLWENNKAMEFCNKDVAYDGEKSLFSVGPVGKNNAFQFLVYLEGSSSMCSARRLGNVSPETGGSHDEPEISDWKRARREESSKTYEVVIRFAARIPIQAIQNALRGGIQSQHYQEAVRVLGIILRQHAAKSECLFVRQSFFSNENNFFDLGDRVQDCRGFHSSFRATQGGLSLNMDVSNTMTLIPGHVIDFLLQNQNVPHPNMIDWVKANRSLTNLRIKNIITNRVHKIIGLSERTCREETFLFRRRDMNHILLPAIEITVYNYYVRERLLDMLYSGDLPCINVGGPNLPTFIPIEYCKLLPLQRYTEALTTQQRANLLTESRQNPKQRLDSLKRKLATNNYSADPMLQSCGMTISRDLTSVLGRVLSAPKLIAGQRENLHVDKGRWNFNNKKLF